MNSIKNLHRLKRLHQLIRSECTGTPYELSRRLHISERLWSGLFLVLSKKDSV